MTDTHIGAAVIFDVPAGEDFKSYFPKFCRSLSLSLWNLCLYQHLSIPIPMGLTVLRTPKLLWRLRPSPWQNGRNLCNLPHLLLLSSSRLHPASRLLNNLNQFGSLLSQRLSKLSSQ